jgi:hypothetical protein
MTNSSFLEVFWAEHLAIFKKRRAFPVRKLAANSTERGPSLPKWQMTTVLDEVKQRLVLD